MPITRSKGKSEKKSTKDKNEYNDDEGEQTLEVEKKTKPKKKTSKKSATLSSEDEEYPSSDEEEEENVEFEEEEEEQASSKERKKQKTTAKSKKTSLKPKKAPTKRSKRTAESDSEDEKEESEEDEGEEQPTVDKRRREKDDEEEERPKKKPAKKAQKKAPKKKEARKEKAKKNKGKEEDSVTPSPQSDPSDSEFVGNITEKVKSSKINEKVLRAINISKGETKASKKAKHVFELIRKKPQKFSSHLLGLKSNTEIIKQVEKIFKGEEDFLKIVTSAEGSKIGLRFWLFVQDLKEECDSVEEKCEAAWAQRIYSSLFVLPLRSHEVEEEQDIDLPKNTAWANVFNVWIDVKRNVKTDCALRDDNRIVLIMEWEKQNNLMFGWHQVLFHAAVYLDSHQMNEPLFIICVSGTAFKFGIIIKERNGFKWDTICEMDIVKDLPTIIKLIWEISKNQMQKFLGEL